MSVLDNPYIFGDPATDRYRLMTQSRLFSDYIRAHAREFVGDHITSILDLGCGEGQLGFVLREVYPDARLVGVDKDDKAIATARSRAATLGLSNTEFVSGDIEQQLPTGAFDLVYASAILTHVHQPAALFSAAYQALAPGGYFWMNDFDPAYFADPTAQAYYGGKYIQMLKLLLDTVQAIGGSPYQMSEAPQRLAAAGFTNIRAEKEYNLVGGSSDVGQAWLGTAVGAFYNARAFIGKVQGWSEAELTALYTAVVNEAMRTKDGVMGWTLNLIAQRPA